ncbi:MAG: tryptophan--tRNA ligase [Rickettsiales bacterium]|jgi:tryptophanyl-tRNA synthetase|nr:tryptophan--tRNA ligase [Rickettsiales bacterium]
MKESKIILTGIKPTGVPHVGNLVGAILPMIKMSNAAPAGSSFAFIADLHALNAVADRREIAQHTREVAAIYLALGLDPERTVFFRQSDIAEIPYLTTLLMNVTPKGLMNRAHSYKAAVDKNITANDDTDAGINMGLYTYPVLMAADILMYGSDIVPVGADQKQHVEFARDIAGYFNNIYGETFKLPEPFIRKETGLIPGLDGRKMSKSYGNQIPIFDTPAELKKKIMRIITDSKLPDEPKDPDTSTIFQLYQHFADAAATADLRAKFIAGGLGYGDAKKILFDALDKFLSGPRAEYERLMANPAEIDAILDAGATRARAVAAPMLSRVRATMLG